MIMTAICGSISHNADRNASKTDTASAEGYRRVVNISRNQDGVRVLAFCKRHNLRQRLALLCRKIVVVQPVFQYEDPTNETVSNRFLPAKLLLSFFLFSTR